MQIERRFTALGQDPFAKITFTPRTSRIVNPDGTHTKTAGETLKEAAAMQGDSDWPRLVIQYLNGEISEDDFRNAPQRTAVTPLKRTSRECEVNCIIGLHKESKHDTAGALAAYQACLATKSMADTEYFIAKLAVQRLQKTTK